MSLPTITTQHSAHTHLLWLLGNGTYPLRSRKHIGSLQQRLTVWVDAGIAVLFPYDQLSDYHHKAFIYLIQYSTACVVADC